MRLCDEGEAFEGSLPETGEQSLLDSGSEMGHCHGPLVTESQGK